MRGGCAGDARGMRGGCAGDARETWEMRVGACERQSPATSPQVDGWGRTRGARPKPGATP